MLFQIKTKQRKQMKIRLKSLFRGPFTNYDDKQVGGVGLQNVNVENKCKNIRSSYLEKYMQSSAQTSYASMLSGTFLRCIFCGHFQTCLRGNLKETNY